MQYPPPQPQPPLQPAKKKSGCLLALGIVGGILLVIGIIVGVLVYKAVSSPEGQKAMTLIGESAKLGMEAANAPGTKELRDLGCAQALVMDLERIASLARELDASAESPVAKEFRLQVTCTLTSTKGAPTCDQVATTYRTAVGTPAGKYSVAVAVTGNKEPSCAALYGTDGVKIRDVKP
jgi:hypothetical protein